MECQACGSDNPEKMKFCGGCGNVLGNVCPECGFDCPRGFRFCGKCGAVLGKSTPRSIALPSPARKQREVDAERRQLTVMFCDLVGSTALAEQLDPEELREIVREYQQTCVEVVERFEGHVAQYLGDGLLIYFGFPQAHEDDARRAVYSGLGIREAMEKLSLRMEGKRGIRLAVRVGIHTGPVVTGEMGAGKRQEQLALGQTPNIAARLQNLAEPNAVVLSASTHHLVRGFFSYQSLGTKILKGVSDPMEVYQTLHQGDAHNRFEFVANRGLSPLVGRDSQMDLMLRCLDRVRMGHGQVVLLSGEAGIGKSRLVHMFRQRAATQFHASRICHCSPYFQNSAFHPLIELLLELCQFRREDSAEQKLRKLEEYVESLDVSLEETVPHIASLLSVSLREKYKPLGLSPQRQKKKILETLLTLLLKLAAKDPVLVLVEDLHWIDPSTLEFLDLLINQMKNAQVFLLLTFRPGFTPPWAECSSLTSITLDRLNDEAVRSVVAGIASASGKSLPAKVVRQIVEKTDGVPLFVEELTKMVVESGLIQEGESPYELADTLPDLAIPTTLQDSLMARLDRLSTVKGVAQLAAVLGREFSYEMLQTICFLDEGDLRRNLSHLLKAELIFQQGVLPHATYIFKHALIQDAAYHSLLKTKRQQYHQRIADSLLERFPQQAAEQPELVAHHYTEANLAASAIGYWLRAGQLAQGRSANLEAIDHLGKGLSLLEPLTETPENDRLELTLQIALGASLITTRGYTDPAVERTYVRAEELCERSGRFPEHFWILIGLQLYHTVRGDLPEALRLSHQLLVLAESQDDPSLISAAYLTLGSTQFLMGDFREALPYLEQAFDLAPEDSVYRIYSGSDIRVLALAFGALTLWHLGESDRASQRGREAIALARKIAHPHTLVAALIFAGAELHQYQGDGEAVRDLARQVLEISEEQDFAHWIPEGTIYLIWGQHHAAIATTSDGEKETADPNLDLTDTAGLRQMIEQHQGVANSYFFCLLVEILVKQGRIEEAMRAVTQGLALVEARGERFWDAELYRLRGELILTYGDQGPVGPGNGMEEAERACRKALEVARRQGSKSLELRAAQSLARCPESGALPRVWRAAQSEASQKG